MTPIEFHTGYLGTPKKKYKEGKEPEDFEVYDCPFCDASQHLYFFPSNTTWDCKVCTPPPNNVYSFIRMIYNDVGTRKVDELKKIWELPIRVFEKIKYNPLNNTWLLPTFRDGKLNNLYKITQARVPDKKNGGYKDAVRVMGTPGIPTTLCNWPLPESDEVWICEGQKDKLAADAIIGSKPIEAVGCPGASSFQQSWAMGFEDKDIVICFDNDDPGKKGTKKIIDIFKNSHYKPHSIKRLVWPEDIPNGYDLYDHYQEHKGSSYAHLHGFFEEVVEDDITKVTSEAVTADTSCDTYDKALESLKAAYHVSLDMETAFAVILASIYSTNIEGEQVWVKLIGRPGCGKSTLNKVVSGSDYVKSVSTFTGVFSGHKDNDGNDASLVPKIKNRTLIVKDADALMKQKNIEQIMSQLRDFYDKDSNVHYGNMQEFNYQNVRSTFIMMGTQVLRRADQSFLGERLLSLEMDVTPKDEEEINKRVVANALSQALGDKIPTSRDVMSALKGFIDHLKARETKVEMKPEHTDAIVRLCGLAAKLRTQVDRDFHGRLLSPATTELPTRLIGQLINTAISLCVVFDIPSPNEKVMKIIRKIIKDTINPRSHRFALCDIILDVPGISATQIEEHTNLNKKTIYEEINDLIELKFIEVRKVNSSRPGLKTRGYWLAPHIANEFKEITR